MKFLKLKMTFPVIILMIKAIVMMNLKDNYLNRLYQYKISNFRNKLLKKDLLQFTLNKKLG